MEFRRKERLFFDLIPRGIEGSTEMARGSNEMQFSVVMKILQKMDVELTEEIEEAFDEIFEQKTHETQNLHFVTSEAEIEHRLQDRVPAKERWCKFI